MKFYCTFGQSHVHPLTGEKMKDYWIEVYGINRYEAWQVMASKYKYRWATQYHRDEFDKLHFSKGCYETLGTKSAEDELDDLLEEIYDKRKASREAERIRDANNQLLSQEQLPKR